MIVSLVGGVRLFLLAMVLLVDRRAREGAAPQAVGLIFGANLGTMSTGWLVALIGLKVQLGALAFPLIAAGVVLRLAGRGWVSPLGFAVAGFGLLFLGIDVL